jgi:hypothetical protein
MPTTAARARGARAIHYLPRTGQGISWMRFAGHGGTGENASK